MDRAAATLARAWHREWRGWWWTSAISLAAILVVVLGTAGLLEGMERATESRVADFYTGSVRVTPDEVGAAPAGRFAANGSAGLAALQDRLAQAAGDGARVEARLETTYILSRRGLVEAYLFEDEQFGVSLPGVAAERDAYAVGVLAGLGLDDGATRDRLRPYLVTGAFPQAAGNASEVEVLMSVGQFRSMLDPLERERVGDVPGPGELAALRMEITAARVDDSGPFKDIIRYPARVTGLYDSGIDALDRITLVTPIEDARRLLGDEPDSGQANVLTVHGGDAGAARAEADRAGWVSEGPSAFTQRYLGQLVAVVRVLGLTLSSLLLAFPFFMVWVGLAQQLDRSRRELAVCRAIGVGPRSVGSALLRLTGRVAVRALVPAAAILLLAAWFLPRWLGPGIEFPFPLGFAVPLWALLVTVANLLVAGTIAIAGAMRRHRKADLAGTLRSL